MIKTDKYLRIKSGEANFQLVERFDICRAPAGALQISQGSSTEETREVPGSKAKSI